MPAALAGALAVSGVWLVAASWRRRSVLALVCGMLGIASALLAAIAGRPESVVTSALLGSLAAIVIGTVLLALGQALQGLLDQEPDERA